MRLLPGGGAAPRQGVESLRGKVHSHDTCLELSCGARLSRLWMKRIEHVEVEKMSNRRAEMG